MLLSLFSLLPQQFFEGVLDEALGQDFRCVIAGRLLTVAAGQAVDEAALLVDDLLVVLVLDDLAFLVVANAARRHEVGLERLAFGGGLARKVLAVLLGGHLVEVFTGEEACVGEQALVDGAELVDAELGVGDAAAGLSLLLGRQGEELKDLLEDVISEANPLQQLEAIVVKQGAVERVDLHVRPGEGHLDRLRVTRGELGKTQVEDAEENLEAVVQEEAVLSLRRRQRDQLEIPKALEAVALAIGIRLHRNRAEVLASGLDVKEKKETIEPGEALRRQLGRELIVVEDTLLLDLSPVPDRFVRDQLDGAAHSVLEVARHGVGMLVRVLVECVVEAEARVRRKHVPVEEARQRAKGDRLFSTEEVSEVEAEVLSLRPLAPLDEESFAAHQEKHPTGRLLRLEEVLVENLAPAGGFAFVLFGTRQTGALRPRRQLLFQRR